MSTKMLNLLLLTILLGTISHTALAKQEDPSESSSPIAWMHCIAQSVYEFATSTVSYQKPSESDINLYVPASTQIEVVNDATSERESIYNLPGDQEYRKEFLNLGFVFSAEVSKSSVFVRAKLPVGWSKKDQGTYYEDHLNYWIVDANEIPRVTVNGKTAIYDQYAYASFLTVEEGKSLLETKNQKEQEEAEAKSKQEHEKNRILEARSSVGSEKNSFAVIFVKDMRYFRQAGYVDVNSYRACKGFFPTEEIAKLAVEYLERKVSNSDSVFYDQLDRQKSEIIRNGYKIVGFEDNNWWNTRSFDSKNYQAVWED